jgi:hypothetical protein
LASPAIAPLAPASAGALNPADITKGMGIK